MLIVSVNCGKVQVTAGPRAVVTLLGSVVVVYELRTDYVQRSFQIKVVEAAVIVHIPTHPVTVGVNVKV